MRVPPTVRVRVTQVLRKGKRNTRSTRRNTRKRKRPRKSKFHPQCTRRADKLISLSTCRLTSDIEEELDEPVCSINPDEIPVIPENKFLLDRQSPKEENGRGNRGHDDRREYHESRVSFSGSGRQIRGRGELRYRTPDRSRSRSTTPPHWRSAERRKRSLESALRGDRYSVANTNVPPTTVIFSEHLTRKYARINSHLVTSCLS